MFTFKDLFDPDVKLGCGSGRQAARAARVAVPLQVPYKGSLPTDPLIYRFRGLVHEE